MEINKINEGIPVNEQLRLLNDMVLKVSGKLDRSNFNGLQLDSIYSSASVSSRQHKTDVVLGNTSSTYSNWSLFVAKEKYNIWKYNISDYVANSDNLLLWNNRKLKYLGTSEEASGSVAFTFDGTFQSTNFPTTLLDSTTSELDIESPLKFKCFDFVFNTLGAGYNLSFSYYNGTFSNLTVTDSTDNFTKNGRVSFTAPSDWITQNSLYKVRVKNTTTATVPAVVKSIEPCTSIDKLLTTTGRQLEEFQFGFGDNGTNIYVVIPSVGNNSYNGNNFIYNDTDDTVLRNFFIHNNKFEINYRVS